MLHPAVRLVVWGATAAAAQLIDAIPLFVLAAAVVLSAAVIAAARLRRLLRRTRWLFAAIALLFAWGTPGVLLWPDLGTFGPSVDGLRLAATQAARLLVVLASLAILLEVTPPEQLVGALYGLLAPLRGWRVDRARVAVRLMLVLRYAEAEPRPWRDWIDPAAAPQGPQRIALQRAPLRLRDGVVLTLMTLGIVLAYAA